jgi:hypothetical protein
MKSTKHRSRSIAGWIAVALSTTITSFWAFWGIIENFHEGWFYESPWLNLGLMLVQYLGPMLIFLGVSLASLFWPRVGGVLHWAFALLAAWFFQAFSNAATFLLILPLFGIGFLYWYGRLQSKSIASLMITGIPLLTLGISGIAPIIRVSQRHDDGVLQARAIHGYNVDLIWAPDGPGWPRIGADWPGAQRACALLSEDGRTLQSEENHYWRLPTIEETVRSMALHGENCAGEWDQESETATYSQTPDKESPLWNVHSQVIYWWSASEVDEDHAFIIAYDGKVWRREKQFGPAYLGFRCVK